MISTNLWNLLKIHLTQYYQLEGIIQKNNMIYN